MKTLVTLAAAAALIAGVSVASAQNAGGPANPTTSPSNINSSPHYVNPSSQSGAEGTTAATAGKIKKNDKTAAEKKEMKSSTTGSASSMGKSDMTKSKMNKSEMNKKEKSE